MNRMIRRVSIALASATLAGGALLATGGAASAATDSAPVRHAHSSVVTSTTSGAHEHGHGSRLVERDDDRRGAHSVQVVYLVDAAGWHEDQVEAASWQYVDAARWHEDQVTWYLNHR
ncbi:hypothetical protein ACFV0T_28130 [Streptomyces sp. NPDC059582]|uniref:hypothetical protein n=1 Tax=Streptomyces sp. NPDC059582 TaxID=3346875 RepID=UPI003674CA86